MGLQLYCSPTHNATGAQREWNKFKLPCLTVTVRTPSPPHPHNITCGRWECEVTRLLRMWSAREWRQQRQWGIILLGRVASALSFSTLSFSLIPSPRYYSTEGGQGWSELLALTLGSVWETGEKRECVNQNIKALHFLKTEATQAPGIVLSLYGVLLCYLKISHFLQIFTCCPTLLHFSSFPYLVLSHLSVLPLLSIYCNRHSHGYHLM